MPPCTGPDLGNIFGDLTERRIQQLVTAGVIVRLSKGKYDLWPSVKGYINYLKDLAVADEKLLTKENLRLKEIQRKKLEGELVDAKAMEEALVKTFGIVRNRIRAIGPKCAQQIYHIKIAKSKKIEQIVAIEKILRVDHDDALNELSLVHVRSVDAIPIKEPIVKKSIKKKSIKKKPIKNKPVKKKKARRKKT